MRLKAEALRVIKKKAAPLARPHPHGVVLSYVCAVLVPWARRVVLGLAGQRMDTYNK
jgi:hypothetical protein